MTVAPLASMSKSQDDQSSAPGSDEYKRLYDVGANHDAASVQLLIERMGDRICRDLFALMLAENITFEEASISFGRACLRSFQQDQQKRLGELLESEIGICDGEIDD